MIAGLMLDATSLDLSGSVAKAPGDRSLAEMKVLAPGMKYSGSKSTASSNAVEKRQAEASPA